MSEECPPKNDNFYLVTKGIYISKYLTGFLGFFIAINQMIIVFVFVKLVNITKEANLFYILCFPLSVIFILYDLMICHFCQKKKRKFVF